MCVVLMGRHLQPQKQGRLLVRAVIVTIHLETHDEADDAEDGTSALAPISMPAFASSLTAAQEPREKMEKRNGENIHSPDGKNNPNAHLLPHANPHLPHGHKRHQENKQVRAHVETARSLNQMPGTDAVLPDEDLSGSDSYVEHPDDEHEVADRVVEDEELVRREDAEVENQDGGLDDGSGRAVEELDYEDPL